jgi:hypothetical protein
MIVEAQGGREGPSVVVAPNPTNPSATLSIRVAAPGFVRVSLFTVDGRLVRHMADIRDAPAGTLDLRLDGHDDRGCELASGVYLYRVETAAGVASGRITVLR